MSLAFLSSGLVTLDIFFSDQACLHQIPLDQVSDIIGQRPAIPAGFRAGTLAQIRRYAQRGVDAGWFLFPHRVQVRVPLSEWNPVPSGELCNYSGCGFLIPRFAAPYAKDPSDT